MKKIHLVLMVPAFSGAFVSKANLLPNVYAHTTAGCCVSRPAALQANCSPTNSGPQCTVYVPGGACVGPNQVAPAFNDTNCTIVLHRP
jgi:hypothetical protein